MADRVVILAERGPEGDVTPEALAAQAAAELAQAAAEALRDETQQLRDEVATDRGVTGGDVAAVESTRAATEALRDETQVLRDETQVLRDDVSASESATSVLRDETRAFRDEVEDLRDDTVLKNESAASYAADAANAVASAELAAEASGGTKFYDDHAAATAALGSLSEGQVVELHADETRNGRRSRYVVEAGVLVFKIHLTSFKPPISYFNGSITSDETVYAGERAIAVDLTVPDGHTLTVEDGAVLVVL